MSISENISASFVQAEKFLNYNFLLRDIEKTRPEIKFDYPVPILSPEVLDSYNDLDMIWKYSKSLPRIAV